MQNNQGRKEYFLVGPAGCKKTKEFWGRSVEPNKRTEYLKNLTKSINVGDKYSWKLPDKSPEGVKYYDKFEITNIRY